MGPVLNGLIKLQSVQNRLGAAKAKLARCRRNVVIQENHIRSLQNTVEAKREEMQLTKIQSDRLELELKIADESIAKLRASLNAAKTNKEYAAVLTQLNTTKADNSKTENQVLDLMKDIEADETEIKELQSQVEAEKEKLEHVRKESESLATKYQAEIDEIQVQWDEVANSIPPEPLGIFKRVAETYDGEALAVIDHNEGGIYTCGGCFMSITVETVNLLMAKDDIIRCPNCTRILVLSDSMEK
ncbi:MAG: zinc ribbon domain-containing protein [Planctomycetota bacterium]|jgi:predicted  nucleic acid-binding Zn-ribbon protein